MITVVVIAGSAERRAALRARAEGPGIEVVAERASPADVGDGPFDVMVVEGAAAFVRAMDVASDTGDVAVVGLIADVSRAESLVRDADVRGWALIPETATAGELTAAIAAAAAGLGAWPASWSAHLTGGSSLRVGFDPDPDEDAPDAERVSDRLTAREQEVLELLSEGLSNRRIAERLGMSEHTAKFHVAAIYGKLEVSGRAAAVNRALRRGLIKI